MNESHHWGWIIFCFFTVLIIAGITSYVFTINRPDIANYAKGSTHPEQNFHNIGLIVLQPGCQNAKAEDYMKEKRNAKPIVNSSR